MFRETRRERQRLGREECEVILRNATSGVLSLVGDEGYPYGVPLSHAYVEGRLVFHGAPTGHKMDAIRANPKACFTVVQEDSVIPEEYTTYFRSAMAFGCIRELEEEEKHAALVQLGERFWPGHPQECEAEINPRLGHMAVFVMEVEHLSGKQARELT